MFSQFFAKACIVTVVALYLASYSLAPFPDTNWPAYAKLLIELPTSCEKNVSCIAAVNPDLDRRTTVYSPSSDEIAGAIDQSYVDVGPTSLYEHGRYALQLPIAPVGWYMTLFIPEEWPGIAEFSEGLRLLDYELTFDADTLVASLFWVGNPTITGSDAKNYTAYVHLLNDVGERVAGYDTLLTPPTNVEYPKAVVFQSEHRIEAPAGVSDRPYHLAIGLYQLRSDGSIIPGSSIFTKEFLLSSIPGTNE